VYTSSMLGFTDPIDRDKHLTIKTAHDDFMLTLMNATARIPVNYFEDLIKGADASEYSVDFGNDPNQSQQDTLPNSHQVHGHQSTDDPGLQSQGPYDDESWTYQPPR
jgi:hypothetical protein